MKKKLIFIILGSIFISYIILIVLSYINVKNISQKGAQEKAIIAAGLVESGLTAHMVNGIMSSRGYFLAEIKNTPNIESLWLSRSDSLVNQFGEGFDNEKKRDKIVNQVISSGKISHEIIETSGKTQLRTTVPYIASTQGKINCMSCHNANEGDVLGTVSIVIDVSDIKANGVLTLAIVLGISILMMIVISIIIAKSINPIMSLFESIGYVMGSAKNGDYTKIVVNYSHDKELKNVTLWINSLLDKLQDTLQEIEKTAGEFLTLRIDKNKDILIELKDIIQEISSINKFRKTIDYDSDKLQIYSRIGTILIHVFKLDNFILVEKNRNDSSNLQIVYSTFQDKTYQIKPTCRAFNTKHLVNSDQFDKLCNECNKEYKHYLCVPYIISNDLELLLHINTEDHTIIERAKNNLDKFQNYIDQAKPEIVSRNLTEILRVSSTTDPLTGLYNRTYLDEYIDKAIAQANRSDIHYGVLMIDIDFFKMVNDTYGHDIGDIVIKKLSVILKQSIREADIAFRFGGEEFLVLLYNCETKMVKEIAEKIKTTFEKEIIKAEDIVPFSKTLSIGTSMFPIDSTSFWKVIKFADIALYEAKDGGRNKVIEFEQAMIDKKGVSSDF